MTRRHQPTYMRRGPPFVEVDGRLYLNLAFDLEPKGEDVRDNAVKALWPWLLARDLLLLRRLTDDEERVVRADRLSGDIEAWAKLTA